MKKIFIILISCMFLSNCSKLNIFGFGKSKNEFEKYSVNEPLWKSSLSFLSKYPNVETNLKEGFISTEWIISNKNPNTRFRITIYILGLEMLDENIRIVADKENNVNGQWVKVYMSSSFNNNLEKVIITKAKRL
mgnify:FL=1